MEEVEERRTPIIAATPMTEMITGSPMVITAELFVLVLVRRRY
jgi:hypothetical protein